MNIKAFINGSKIGMFIGIIVGILITASLVYAASTFILKVPAKVNITDPYASNDLSIQLFRDSGGIIPVTVVDYGNITRGTTDIGQEKLGYRLYVKNIGNVPIDVTASVNIPLDVGYGGGGTTYVGIGETREIGVWWHTRSNSPLGTTNFELVFTSELHK
jgi:archaellum component FlaG (FlaF/FlaG flagellin family)